MIEQPGKHTPDWTCQSGVKRAKSLLYSSLLPGRRFVAEFSVFLQAAKGIQDECILRVSIGQANHVQEGIRRNAAITRIWNCGAYQPDGASVSAVDCFLSFCSAVVGLKLVVEFGCGQNDGS